MFLLFNNTSQSLESWDLYNVTEGNTSEYEFETEDGVPHYNLVERIFIIIFLAVIIFFSIFGNILVVVAVLTDRKLRKPSNHFIISLAVADLLVAVLVMTFAVANDIVGYWIFDRVFCTVWISFDIMCSTASILNLCAISFDRYTHIRNPLRYEMVMTSKRIFIILGVIWLVSALMSFVPLQLGWHRYGLPEKFDNKTELFQCVLELNPIYAVCSSIISFFLPCLIMILIYFKLFQYARKQVKSIKRTCIGSLNNGSPDSKHSQYKVSDHKAAITLGVIMGTFLLCWLPFFTINIIGAFCGKCISPLTFVIVTWLGYFNSTLNPVIYSIFNTEFREAFKKVLSFEKCVKLRDIDFKVTRTLRHGAPIRNAEYGALSQKASEEKDLQDHITSV